MDEVKPEVAVDIGGGLGEYFFRLAKENPRKIFIVLDPKVRPIKKAPENLFLIKWRTDVGSKLPFLPNKIDEAYLNFLFGVIEANEERGFDTRESNRRYRALLKDLKDVLKPNSSIHLVDVRGNIFRIQQLLEEEGYQIIQEPKRLKDESRTAQSKFFTEALKKIGETEEEPRILPMEIEAKWEGGK